MLIYGCFACTIGTVLLDGMAVIGHLPSCNYVSTYRLLGGGQQMTFENTSLSTIIFLGSDRLENEK
jgi:hypothetical protein